MSASDRAGQIVRAQRTVIESRVATFKGRRRIVDTIDGWLRDPGFPSGYVLITGEPGIGKTALASYLTVQRAYVCHLNDRRQGVTTVADFHRSVCRQLAERLDVPIPADPDSAALSALLKKASEAADVKPPLVIVVDALDESALPSAGGNRLLLPQVLPPHVYFIITSRPLSDYRLSVDPPRVISMKDDDPDNIADIRSYVRGEMQGPFAADFARRVSAWGVSRDAFVEILTEKSQGNFLYIHHMLASVRQDMLTRAALEDINRLPVGLRDYYEDHYRNVMAMRWPPALWRKHEAAIRCIAAIGRPVSPSMLVDLAGEQNMPGVDYRLAKAIITHWLEFFNSVWDTEYDQERFFVYHDTFREFLESVEPLGPLELALYDRERAQLMMTLYPDD
jgi:hypothetical protein